MGELQSQQHIAAACRNVMASDPTAQAFPCAELTHGCRRGERWTIVLVGMPTDTLKKLVILAKKEILETGISVENA